MKRGKKRSNEQSDPENERGKSLRQEEPSELKFTSSLAWWIIASLRFFDCPPSEIFRVLQSYDMDGTIFEIARYINDLQLPNYQSFPPFENGPSTHDFSGIACTVDFANRMPVRSVLSYYSISPLTPTEIVNATTSDGQMIITTVKDGEAQCCSRDYMC